MIVSRLVSKNEERSRKNNNEKMYETSDTYVLPILTTNPLDMRRREKTLDKGKGELGQPLYKSATPKR